MDQRVQEVLALMNANLGRGLPLNKLARSVNLSSSRLRCLFKAETGISLAKYFKYLRMEKAKELLETSFLSVKQIAARTGFNDMSHFVRDFKQIYGLTPAAFRKEELSERQIQRKPNEQAKPLTKSQIRQMKSIA